MQLAIAPYTLPLALLVMVAGGCDSSAPELPGELPRHLFLVTFDTTRADRIGCYGYEGAETPTLDRLAATGVRFAQAYTTVPVTLPAHASILSGMYPPTHGVRDNGKFRLPNAVLTLAEALRDQGFETAAFVSAFVLARTFGTDQGFAVYDDRIPSSLQPSFGFAERPADLTTDAAIAWLSGQDLAEQRAFLWVHYFDPHLGYRAPEPYRSRHPNEPYDAEIAFADAELGRLIDHLDEAKILDEALIVVTADHGEGLGEHGETEHGVFIYDTTMRVPLIFAHPSLARGRTVDEPVSVVDIAATVTSLLGVRSLATHGADLTPFLRDNHTGSSPRRPIYLETEYTRHSLGGAPLYGLRNRQYKFISAPRPELYNLGEDPHELQNVIGKQRGIADELADELSGMHETLRPIAENRIVLDDSSRQRLAALGYVAAGSPGTDSEGRDPKDLIRLVVARNQAISLIGQGQLEAAEQMLSKVLTQHPDDEISLGAVGVIALHRRQFQEGEAVFRKLLARGAVSPFLLYNLAIAAYHQGRRDEAGSLLADAVTLDPGFAAGYRLLVKHHRLRAVDAAARGDAPTAVAEIDQSLHYCRRLIEVWYGDPGTLRQFHDLEAKLQETRREVAGNDLPRATGTQGERAGSRRVSS